MDKKWLEDNGFKGFVKISYLKSAGYKEIPKIKGIYVVVRESHEKPVFLDESIGGHFKDKDPTVNLKELESNWVNAQIIYIGKAGGTNSGATLRSRLKQYMEYGKGKNIGHWGGRYIWQLKDSDDLVVAWKVLEEEPKIIESQLIEKFREIYGMKPFANLTK